MKGVPQGRYTKEFREEAVKLVTEEKLSLPEAARRLSLPPSTIGNWIKAYRVGRLGRDRQDTEASDRNRDGVGLD